MERTLRAYEHGPGPCNEAGRGGSWRMLGMAGGEREKREVERSRQR